MDWRDWGFIVVAACLGAASVALRIWFTAVGMVLVVIAAAGRIRWRHTRRSGTTSES